MYGLGFLEHPVVRKSWRRSPAAWSPNKSRIADPAKPQRSVGCPRRCNTWTNAGLLLPTSRLMRELRFDPNVTSYAKSVSAAVLGLRPSSRYQASSLKSPRIPVTASGLGTVSNSRTYFLETSNIFIHLIALKLKFSGIQSAHTRSR